MRRFCRPRCSAGQFPPNFSPSRVLHGPAATTFHASLTSSPFGAPLLVFFVAFCASVFFFCQAETALDSDSLTTVFFGSAQCEYAYNPTATTPILMIFGVVTHCSAC